MARPASIPSGAIAAAFVVAVAGPFGVPGPATAATDGGLILTRHAISSVAADVDGDGAREIFAVVAQPEAGALLRLAAWGVRGGEWVSLGEEGLERWDGAQATARVARLGEATAALLPIRDGDRTRVVAAVAEPYANDQLPGACCLSLSEVSLDAGSGLSVELDRDDLGSVETIQPFDLEADGRDELLVTTYIGAEPEPWTPTFSLLRQADSGFVATAIPEVTGEAMHFSGAGETDAIPGDDLIFLTEDNRNLVRITADGDEVGVERVPAAAVINPSFGGGLAGAADGVIVFAADHEIVTARWPRGRGIEPVTSRETAGWPMVQIAGEGPDARLIEVTGTDQTADATLGLRVLDLNLAVELEVDVAPAVTELWELMQSQSISGNGPTMNLYPQIGPIPGGLADGRAAFLGLGNLVALDPGGAHDVQPAASLVGGDLLGLVGPGAAWVATSSTWAGTGAWAYLGYTSLDEGGLPETRLAVAPMSAVLGPTGTAESDLSIQNATLLDEPDGPILYAGEHGFDAVVSGDRGTLVITQVGGGTTTEEIGGAPLTVTIDPPGRGTLSWGYDTSILLVSPGGIARAARWNLMVLLEAPEVSADMSFELFEGHASVFGEVSPATTVTVDGRAVDPSGDGAYRTQVAASIWPRDVVVVARDPIGHETVQHVEVVGIADVRALPWIPIMAALTVAAGVALFLRTPEVRPERHIRFDGDGHLEEIDADLG